MRSPLQVILLSNTSSDERDVSSRRADKSALLRHVSQCGVIALLWNAKTRKPATSPPSTMHSEDNGPLLGSSEVEAESGEKLATDRLRGLFLRPQRDHWVDNIANIANSSRAVRRAP